MKSRKAHPGSVHRLMMIGILIFLLIPMLTGCDALAPPKPVTITFAVSQREADYYEGLIGPFNEKYAHITVKLLPYDPQEQPDEAALAADVGVVYTFGLPDLLEQNAILDLAPLIAEDRSFDLADFYPAAVDGVTYDGQVWAVPAGVDPWVTYYNKMRFDEAGAAYPESGWTWDDLLNTGQTVRNLQTGTFGYGYWFRDRLLLVYQHGGQIVDDPVDPARTTFDDPLTVEALQWYADMIHVYDVAPSPEELGKWGGNAARAWFNSRIGAITLPLSVPAGRFAGLRCGMVAPPRDARSATWVDVEAFVISSGSQHPEAAWRWIVFLSEQIPDELTPARQALAESAAYEEKAGADDAAMARELMAYGFAFGPKVYVEFGDALDVFNQAIEQIESGESTPQEAMSWAQQEAESIE